MPAIDAATSRYEARRTGRSETPRGARSGPWKTKLRETSKSITITRLSPEMSKGPSKLTFTPADSPLGTRMLALELPSRKVIPGFRTARAE